MFDVGFSELVVIALVALIVIGPERLPKVARTVGHLLGRLQRYANEVKADINREMQLEELKKLQAQLAEQAKNMESSVTHEIRETEAALNRSIGAAATPTPPPVAAPEVAASAAVTATPAAPSDSAAPAVVPPTMTPESTAVLVEEGDAAKQLALGLDLPAEKPKS
jgi:sec-independent protein translocase protein TatB